MRPRLVSNRPDVFQHFCHSPMTSRQSWSGRGFECLRNNLAWPSLTFVSLESELGVVRSENVPYPWYNSTKLLTANPSLTCSLSLEIPTLGGNQFEENRRAHSEACLQRSVHRFGFCVCSCNRRTKEIWSVRQIHIRYRDVCISLAHLMVGRYSL